jgi:hypothetical protein
VVNELTENQRCLQDELFHFYNEVFFGFFPEKVNPDLSIDKEKMNILDLS